MAIPFNQTLIKKENKQHVLQIIRQNGPISRAETAQTSGLNKGTVSSLVAELLQEQLVSEIGPGESSGGRKPVMLHFHAKAGFTIGIDIGVNYLFVVLNDLTGSLVHSLHAPLIKTDVESVMTQLTKMVHSFISLAPNSPYGIIGIGVGVPGIVSKDGVILNAPNLHWKHVDVRKRLHDLFDLPIWIDNEANFGAIGEKEFGSSVSGNNILYISAGIGIGAGLLLDNHLYKGSNGHAGEVGHMTVDFNGPLCHCGNYGCWELYASENALLTHAPDGSTFEGLLASAKQGHTDSLHLFGEIATYLGAGIVSLVHTFSPDQIIVGNRLGLAAPFIKPDLIRSIKRRMLPEQFQATEILFSSLGTHATAFGAANFAAERFIENENVHNPVTPLT